MAAIGWLRVALYDMCDVAFDHFETPLRHMRSNIVYSSGVLARQPGFVGGHWGVDLDDAKIAAVTRWTGWSAIEAAQGDLDRLAADAEVHGVHRVHLLNLELFPASGTGPAADTAETRMRIVSYAIDARDERAQTYMAGHLQDARAELDRQPGFQGGCWGRDLGAATMAVVTYWDGRRAIAAARSVLQHLQADAAAAGLQVVDVRNLHLFATTPPRTGSGTGAVAADEGVRGLLDALEQRRLGA